MKQLLEFLATSLVDDKEAVCVEQTKADRKTLYSLSVKQDDLGKVIGKKGRTVKAMRILLSAFASMQGRQVGLQVIEPEVQEPSVETPIADLVADVPSAPDSEKESV